MKVTIKDIAKKAKVSITSVSLVLNNKPSRISKDKQEEIKRIASEYNYVPNMVAKSLVSRHSNTIGLVIPDLENTFFASLSKSICDTASRFGYTIIISNSNDEYINDFNTINKLSNLGVDGLLICVSNESYQYQDIIKKELLETKIPFVMVDRTFKDFNCNKVFFDNILGGYLQTKYAIENNHKNIAYLSTKDISENGYNRFLGYKKALNEYGVVFDEKNVFQGDYHFSSGFNAAKDILKVKDITALICANDQMAYGFINYLRTNNIKSDILIIGYDDLLFNKMIGINMVSISQDVNKLGSDSFELLMKSIENNDYIEQIKLEPTLVEHVNKKQ